MRGKEVVREFESGERVSRSDKETLEHRPVLVAPIPQEGLYCAKPTKMEVT